MNRRETYEDVSFLLLFVPFIASGLYALYLWSGLGISFILPEQAYLGATRNPDIFLIGTLAVLLSVLLEVTTEDPRKRSERAATVSRRLQRLAAATFILAVITAWYANGFALNLGGTGLDLFLGRFTIVFPALLILLSFLIITPLKLGDLAQTRTLAMVILLAVPLVIYEVGRRNVQLGLAASLLMTVIAVVILSLKREPKKELTTQ